MSSYEFHLQETGDYRNSFASQQSTYIHTASRINRWNHQKRQHEFLFVGQCS